MSISFVRVDDRMIHGQTVTRWSLEYPCTGLIAVNDAAAKNPVLKGAYKSASDKKTFVWGVDEFIAKSKKVVESKDPRRCRLCSQQCQNYYHRTLQRSSRRCQARQQPVHHTGRGRGTRSDHEGWLRDRVRACQRIRDRQLEEIPRPVRFHRLITGQIIIWHQEAGF